MIERPGAELDPAELEARLAELRYDLPEALVLPPGCRALRLAAEGATRAFVASALRHPHSRWRTWGHRFLSRWISDFDVNALLDMYPLFLLAQETFHALLASSDAEPGGSLLDVGAGSGAVTGLIAPLFGDVTVTETSRGMARVLGRRGYRTLNVELGRSPARTAGLTREAYDVVTVFNVLDRTARPRALLEGVHELLAPKGRLVLATPLPFRPFYYAGPRTLDPEENLGLTGNAWAEDARVLLREVLPAAGFRPRVVSRLPYLSGGDARSPLYVLDDLIVVCERVTSAQT